MSLSVNALSIELEPDWDAIQSVWDPCVDFFGASGIHADQGYALSMVVQELLENAVKYGSYRGTARVGLSVEVTRETVSIDVRTPLGTDLHRLQKLDRMVQWLRGFQNPFEAYVERMKEISAGPSLSSESGLGLVRIAYEGRCLLDFYVDDANTLAMSAIYDRAADRPAVSSSVGASLQAAAR